MPKIFENQKLFCYMKSRMKNHLSYCVNKFSLAIFDLHARFQKWFILWSGTNSYKLSLHTWNCCSRATCEKISGLNCM